MNNTKMPQSLVYKIHLILDLSLIQAIRIIGLLESIMVGTQNQQLVEIILILALLKTTEMTVPGLMVTTIITNLL